MFTVSLSYAHTHSLSYAHTHSLSHTHTHTLSLIRTHTLSLTDIVSSTHNYYNCNSRKGWWDIKLFSSNYTHFFKWNPFLHIKHISSHRTYFFQIKHVDSSWRKSSCIGLERFMYIERFIYEHTCNTIAVRHACEEQKSPIFSGSFVETDLQLRGSYECDMHAGDTTGWRRLIGSPKLQISFHKRATKYRALLLKMTYKDKEPYESSPPCTHLFLHNQFVWNETRGTKEPLNIGLFCWKWPIKIRKPMSLRHSVRIYSYRTNLFEMNHKRATKYRPLLLKMTYKDKETYESSPPCMHLFLQNQFVWNETRGRVVTHKCLTWNILIWTYMYYNCSAPWVLEIKHIKYHRTNLLEMKNVDFKLKWSSDLKHTYMNIHISHVSLRLVGSFKLWVSFAEYSLFYRALLWKKTCNFKEPTAGDNAHWFPQNQLIWSETLHWNCHRTLNTHTSTYIYQNCSAPWCWRYGAATISRLLQIMGRFCRL